MQLKVKVCDTRCLAVTDLHLRAVSMQFAAIASMARANAGGLARGLAA